MKNLCSIHGHSCLKLKKDLPCFAVPYHPFFPSQLIQIEIQHPLTAAVRRAHPLVSAQALSPVQVVRRHFQGTRCATLFDSQPIPVHHILVRSRTAPIPGSRPAFCAVRRISPLRPENFSAPSGEFPRLALHRPHFLHFCLCFYFVNVLCAKDGAPVLAISDAKVGKRNG